MSVSVSMPQLGESVTEGTVTRWLKREGEHVQADEPLLEVSTDKVDTEIPSPVSGILRGITVAEDETVAVGAELAVIDEDGAAGGASSPAAAAAEAPAAEPAASYAQPEPSAPAAASYGQPEPVAPAAASYAEPEPAAPAASYAQPEPAPAPAWQQAPAAPAPPAPPAEPDVSYVPPPPSYPPAAASYDSGNGQSARHRPVHRHCRRSVRHAAGAQARRRERHRPVYRDRHRSGRPYSQAGHPRRGGRPARHDRAARGQLRRCAAGSHSRGTGNDAATSGRRCPGDRAGRSADIGAGRRFSTGGSTATAAAGHRAVQPARDHRADVQGPADHRPAHGGVAADFRAAHHGRRSRRDRDRPAAREGQGRLRGQGRRQAFLPAVLRARGRRGTQNAPEAQRGDRHSFRPGDLSRR